MKFSGKNFQPWPDFSLDINGLTIVIGPSNEGKSSIYRALRGVLRNDIDAAYIRNPKDEPLELEIEHAGHVIKATRSKKGSVKYVIDGKDYAKLAGDVPETIKDLKFGEIRLGDFTFDPIFAGQNKAQFLIDNESFKPAEINAILGAFGGTEKLEFGKKQANLLKTQKDSEARVLAAQIRSAEDRKTRLEGMAVQGRQLSDTLHALEAAIRKLESGVHWYEQALVYRHRLLPLQQILETLVLPDISGIEQLQQTVVYAEQAAFAASFARWMSKPLSAIEAATNDWSAVMALWKQIKGLNETVAVLDSEIIDLSELTAFNTDISTEELIDLQTSIKHLEGTAALRKELKETATKLTDIDGELSTLQTQLASVQAELQRVEMEKAQQKMQAELEEAQKGICPKCGKTMEHVCQ